MKIQVLFTGHYQKKKKTEKFHWKNGWILLHLQVTQETDNVILQQITTMTQQALPLLPTSQDKALTAAPKAESKTKEKVVEPQNHSAEKNKEDGSLDSDAANSDRYSVFICFFYCHVFFIWDKYIGRHLKRSSSSTDQVLN